MLKRQKFHLKLPSGALVLGERALVMGVLNVTPDSFSDGGKFLEPTRAVEHALEVEKAGADLLDIGGESTRPGSEEMPAATELSRVLPVLDRLRANLHIPISIDTRKAEVAKAAIAAGAQIINDVSGLKHDGAMAEVAARHKVPLILMHMRGEPATMQNGPFARDVLKDVMQGLRDSAAKALKAGVRRSQIILDPGIGFGKTSQQNYALLQKLPELAKLGYPLLVGTSRKGFLGATLARDGTPAAPDQRLWATAATVAASIFGGAHVVRVHDVREMIEVVRVADAVLTPPKNLKT